MASSGTSGGGDGAKECRIELVVVECAGGPVALGYPVNAKPPPTHHIPKDQVAAVPVTTASVGGEIPVTGRHPAAPGNSHSSTRRSAARRHCYRQISELAVTIFIAAFLIWLYLSYHQNPLPKQPTFSVKDFAVSNFSISNYHGRTALAANWEATITVVNPNRKHTLSLEKILSFVYYYDDTSAGQLSLGSVEPLHLDKNSSASITVKTTTNLTGSDRREAALVENIRQKLRNTGTLSFSLGIHLNEDFSHHFYIDVVTAYCEGLKVDFLYLGDIVVGTLSTDNPRGEVSCWTSYCDWPDGITKSLDC
ncbi:hypothetical protein CDL15_Pgr006141 [Punica granatum]|uniref:Late embryogenesis abundant protein LEA-2 subgroup domain-containing protein n=1 Tax=Punica granatum TaxID=22663 RepID=A0A218VUC6_PUNGR|nr:hypothetical protein CDL15_Pgr006141 [Punica granatum]PKI68003.1 hypothetical protein CRG98_011599 [Punica granatum]